MDNYCKRGKCRNPYLKKQLARNKMPQFTKKSVAKLDAAMKKFNHTFKFTRISPLKLYPSQHQINIVTANDILEKWKHKTRSEARKNPLLVSSDGSILDGHHRWLAVRLALERELLPKTYKMPVKQYSSKGPQTLSIAIGLKTPKHNFQRERTKS